MTAAVTETELIEEANEIYELRKTAAKHMNALAQAHGKQLGVDKGILQRVKAYHLYHGNGWNGNPLTTNAQLVQKGRVDPLSGVFAKVLSVIEDLRTVGYLDLLDPYVEELAKFGIKLEYDPAGSLVKDKDELLGILNSMGTFQKEIDYHDEILGLEKAEEADNINLTKKTEFRKLVAFYNKKKLHGAESVEDKYNDYMADNELKEAGYTKVFNDALKA